MSDDEPAASELDRRIHELCHTLETDPFVFDRRLLFRCLSMGHSQFAEIIGALGRTPRSTPHVRAPRRR